MIKLRQVTLIIAIMITGCERQSEAEARTSEVAVDYVKLVLSMEAHDPGIVDYYY
ncbi:hypothetical protein LCGC14_3165490, partial [marine sediment metagenome]